MNGTFEFTDSANCLIGTLAFERNTAQKVSWEVRYTLSLPERDRLEETVDYMEVKKHLHTLVTSVKPLLIETLAKQMLNSLFETFAPLEATLRLKKESVGVILEVSR
ncbi:MAG: hypothetical protein S4CHLAM45_13760 [Chlamydiales bacterium]|nr:hypothetical protein [Chlamydiales bacterium]MCH9620481.1 hypothetical protein [Chlamydiales bacterium]MCH9623466.1 hypothetical protein [Chlamydiales bacterium]